MTELEAIDAMIQRYKDIVENWNNLSLSDVVNKLLGGCLLRPYHPNCWQTLDCPGYKKVCGHSFQIVHAANSGWKKNTVEKYMVETLEVLREWKKRFIGGDI